MGSFYILPKDSAAEAVAFREAARLQPHRDSGGGGGSVCHMPEDILSLPALDLSRGYLADILHRCHMLSHGGEHVMLQLSGPLTVAGEMTDQMAVLRLLRKDPGLSERIKWKIGEELLRYAQAAAEQGAVCISYADAVAIRKILGPSLERWVTEVFTAPFLREMVKRVQGKAMITVCPHILHALLEADIAFEEMWKMPEGTSYGEACVRLRDKVSLTGQFCVHHEDAILPGGIFRQLKIKGQGD